MGVERPTMVRSLIRTIVPPPLKRLYHKARIALHGPIATRRVNGIVIRLSVSTALELFRADTYTSKEPETLKWIKESVRPNDVFYDVGANIGLYGLYVAALQPSCSVYAFEPESQNYASLCRNVVLNNVANIIPCPVPLSHRETFELFHVGEVQAGSSLHALGHPSQFRDGRALLKQGMLTTTLDNLVSRYGLPQPTLIKIDVDGGEMDILQGARNVLQSSSLRSILVEFSYHDDSEVSRDVEELARLGFGLDRMSEWVMAIGGIKSRNFIFKHSGI